MIGMPNWFVAFATMPAGAVDCKGEVGLGFGFVDGGICSRIYRWWARIRIAFSTSSARRISTSGVTAKPISILLLPAGQLREASARLVPRQPKHTVARSLLLFKDLAFPRYFSRKGFHQSNPQYTSERLFNASRMFPWRASEVGF